MSAALAAGKPARSAPNTEYSIVVSSDTTNIATLATQNTGQGDAGRTGATATTSAAGKVAGIMSGSNVVAIDAFRRIAAGSSAAPPSNLA